MWDYKKIFKDREKRLKIIQCLRFVPNKLYLKIVFWIKSGKKLNLKNPKTFCDKQNWLKFNCINWDYTNYVDKIKVHDIIKEKLGKDICFPILGIWDKFENIDFSILPNQFVLKCNHDSGSVKIIKDKNNINYNELKKFFNGRLKINPFYMGREYPYKNVKPQIIAEKYMTPEGSDDINDYKFFCFNGKPEIMFVATNRSTDCKFDFFDMNFNHLDITNIHPQSNKNINKPKMFDEMKNIASKLSMGMKFVRIDLYCIDDVVYFGEYTFFHGGGFWPFYPIEFEENLGKLIEIN